MWKGDATSVGYVTYLLRTSSCVVRKDVSCRSRVTSYSFWLNALPVAAGNRANGFHAIENEG